MAVPAKTSVIRTLADARDPAFAGAKGAGLGELLRAGLPVPEGFVIGTPAYAAFRDSGGPGQLARIALARPLTPADEQSIAGAYRRLGGGREAPVAVRASATHGSGAAEGSLRSFLNVIGAADVLRSVQACWASASVVGDAGLAVVVQHQITPAASGVALTADPATGDESRIAVHALLGLGEAFITGEVTPDRFVVDKVNLAIAARALHRKPVAIVPVRRGGTRRRAVPAAEAMRPALSDPEVRQVAETALRAEEHHGSARLIEWALDHHGNVWLVQDEPLHPRPGP